eukprot:gene7720-10429_t
MNTAIFPCKKSVGLAESAFYELVEQVVARLKSKDADEKQKWLNQEEAMALLNIKSKTSLQMLRDQGVNLEIPGTKRTQYFLTMEAEDTITPDPDYMRGFNEGYTIAAHMPELAEKLSLAVGNGSSRGQAFQDGRQQALAEERESRYPSWLKSDRYKASDREQDKSADREI